MRFLPLKPVLEPTKSAIFTIQPMYQAGRLQLSVFILYNPIDNLDNPHDIMDYPFFSWIDIDKSAIWTV